MKKVAVIGGGAAGMMAAATLLESGGCEVWLLERNNELGKKVKISGGGRCNVTTGVEDLGEVLKKYPRGAKFFRTALYAFPPKEVREWFESHGVPLKVEKDLRVFPVSNDGDDVVGVFEQIFAAAGVKVLFGAAVSAVEKVEGGFLVRGEGFEDLVVDEVILTTGGQAYRHTGSQGDGYVLAEHFGHTITKLGPSLNAFVVKEPWVHKLSGVSFQNARLRMADGEFRGPMLFTHRGVTGPAVFALSSLCAFAEFTRDPGLKLRLDFCADLDYEQLKALLIKETGNQNFARAVMMRTTKSFVREYCAAHDLNLEKKVAELGKKDLNRAVEMLKNCEVTVCGRLPGEEFVTAGGVDLAEVNSKTMESRLMPGLFFAGEILNIDGFTGGYNLQVAWATGRCAALR